MSGKKKFLVVLSVLIVFALAVRVFLPSVLTSVANKQLAKQSPNFSFHIADIDLHIIRGQYVVEGITGEMKPEGVKFLTIDSVVADVPWKSLFQGVVLTDVVVDKLNLSASQALIDKAKLESDRLKKLTAQNQEEEPKKEEKESPLNLRSFKLKNSNISIHDFMSFRGDEVREISNINVVANNLTPKKASGETDFEVTANVFGPAPFRATGLAHVKATPPTWDVNSEMKNFDLTTMNPFVREKVRAFIHKGKLDFYAEAKSTQGAIEGYLKPFVAKMKMDTPPEGFTFTGEAAATGGNIVKILLTDSEAKTLATRVPFTYQNEKLDFKVLPALTKAIEHKANENIKPGIEDKIGQKGLGIQEGDTMQAQEEE